MCLGGREMCKEKADLEEGRIKADTWHCPLPGSHKRYSRLWYPLLSLAFFVLLLSACPLYNPAAFVEHPNGQQTGPDDITSTATQVTLQWDPPASGASQVVSYTVSYRVHGTTTWNTLGSVPASTQASYTVLRSTTGSGSFDFAVACINSVGASSPLHTSLDPTADPTSGWYLTW